MDDLCYGTDDFHLYTGIPIVMRQNIIPLYTWMPGVMKIWDMGYRILPIYTES